jgi:hypothetical protein
MAAATIQNHQELIIGPAPDMVRSPHGKLERGRYHAKHAGNCLCPRVHTKNLKAYQPQVQNAERHLQLRRVSGRWDCMMVRLSMPVILSA